MKTQPYRTGMTKGKQLEVIRLELRKLGRTAFSSSGFAIYDENNEFEWVTFR